MFPYIDLAGFRIRTVMPSEFVDEFETFSPGWLAQNIQSVSSLINSRLRKRYVTPLGQQAPALLSAGTAPPAVTLAGVPTLGSLELLLEIVSPGALGAATFQWAADNGRANVFTGPLTTGALVSLAGTGMQAVFPAGSYSADNVYTAAPPVTETVLRWLVAIVTWNAMCRRYRNSQDPALVTFKDEYDQALAEMREAADSKDGLLELPTTEDQGSAVALASPLGYTETSPYVWQDVQEQTGRGEDHSRAGTGFGGAQ